jgi:membrane-bound serine protease (ClpP class)
MNTILEALFIVLLAVFGAILLSFQSAKALFTSQRFGFALFATQNHEDGFVAPDLSLSSMLGQEGTAFSMLRPGGKVLIENEVYDAICREAFIDKGNNVRVVAINNAQLIVEKV